MAEYHTVTQKVTHRDGRRISVSTCSCGAFLGETDSPKRAAELADQHRQTPECPDCHHRNEHPEGGHCGYVHKPWLHQSTPDRGLLPESTLCFCGLRYTKDGEQRVSRGGYTYIVQPDGTEVRVYG